MKIKSAVPVTCLKVIFPLVVSLFYLKVLMADPRAQNVKIICGTRVEKNSSSELTNFEITLANLSNQLQRSGFGEAVFGTSPYTNYGLAQCFGDLSSLDCELCYAQAHAVLPQCFHATGARVYLDGCFARIEGYNFYEEYLGPNDTVVCGSKTREDQAFWDAASKAVKQAVTNARNSKGYAGERVLVLGEGNASAYALANCWQSLNASSCQACLSNASSRILNCLPKSEGRVLNTGCLLRYSDSDFLNRETKNGISKGTIVVIIISVVSSIILMAAGVTIGMYSWKQRTIQKKRRASNGTEKLVQIPQDSSLNFKYSTLEKATGSFAEANKLGQGGFGTVYKGVLADGREIAIKRLFFNNRHRAADFYNEVNIISNVQHKNLLRLLGCSCSGPESLLVYEFMPNKSLDHFIFDAMRGRTLNWEKRYHIIIGTAEGLFYLHENANARIIHRDIKASNILLDSRFRAKIADFGLARTFQDDKSHISTAIAGTLGYMAPEYLAHGQLTEKADVYSFGVLLLEIVTGRQNNRCITQEYSDNLVTSAWRHFQQRTMEELLDPNFLLPDHGDDFIKEEGLRIMQIGLLCTQEAPSLRPSMSRVLRMLKNKEGNLPFPTSPPFIDEITMELNDICENSSHPLKADASSVATVTFSSFNGR